MRNRKEDAPRDNREKQGTSRCSCGQQVQDPVIYLSRHGYLGLADGGRVGGDQADDDLVGSWCEC